MNDKYYDKTAHAHRLIRTCPIGGNLHLAGTCACFDAHAKADIYYGFKIS